MSRGVRGPNSALTEFLRERGINAAEIRARAQARADAAAAEAANPAANSAAQDGETQSAPASTPAAASTRASRSRASASVSTSVSAAESSSAAAARVAVQTKTKSKAKKRKKSDSDDELDEWTPYSKPLPVPGQIAFCGECNSRFTVTAYSKAAEGGDGLLCNACGKKTAKEDKAVRKNRSTGKKVKREVLRQALDGEARGPKTLKDYCIKLVAKYIDDVEALGDLATQDMDRICQIISRNRSLNNNTLRLFLDSRNDKLTLYDCARIDTNELRNIAAFSPSLKHLSLHHAGRMTDEVLSYYAEKLPDLESLHIRGAFLISREAYTNFFTLVGHRLKSLTLSATARTSQAVIEAIVTHCPNLESVNLSSLARFDDECLLLLGKLRNLTSLDVSFAGGDISDTAVIKVLDSIGSGLQELSLAGNPNITGITTAAIHACCARLRVLDLSECELLTDNDIINLFTNWSKNRGLRELHLARLVALTDLGLQAAVEHSGQMLEVVDVNSCAEVTKAGLMKALTSCKKLIKFDVGFVRGVDDEIVETMEDIGIKTVAVWGCTKVTECCRMDVGVSMVGREADIAA